MLRTLSLITSFFLTAAALHTPCLRTPEVTFDTDPSGGYTGDYVIIYNPDVSADSELSTGSIQSYIQTDIPAQHGGPGPVLIDVDSEAKRHNKSFGP